MPDTCLCRCHTINRLQQHHVSAFSFNHRMCIRHFTATQIHTTCTAHLRSLQICNARQLGAGHRKLASSLHHQLSPYMGVEQHTSCSGETKVIKFAVRSCYTPPSPHISSEANEPLPPERPQPVHESLRVGTGTPLRLYATTCTTDSSSRPHRDLPMPLDGTIRM